MDTITHRSRPILLLLGLLCFLCITPVSALYKSQAGVFDWHQSWIGKTRWSSKLDSSHITVVTERNVVASLNIDNGELEWRQVLEETITHAKITNGGILTLTDEAGHAQYWDRTTGTLVWERYAGQGGQPGQFNIIVLEDDHVALFDGKTLVKLSDNAKDLWTWELENGTGNVLALHSLAETLFVITYDGTSTIYSTALNAATGEVLTTTQIPCRVKADEISVIGNYIMWIDHDDIKWNEIGTSTVAITTAKELVGSIDSFEVASLESLHLIPSACKPGLETFVFGAEIELDELIGATAAAFRISADGSSLELVKNLGVRKSFDDVDVSDSYVAVFSTTSKDTFAVDVLNNDPSIGTHQIHIYHDFTLTGDIAHAKILDLSDFRIFIVTASGSTFVYSKDGIVWSREEAMAHAIDSEFLDLPEKQRWTQMADEISETPEEQAVVGPVTRYIRRLTTHVAELRKVPSWAIERVMGVVSPPAQQKANPAAVLAAQSCWTNQSYHQQQKTNEDDDLYRDNFGFRKLLLSVTNTGKVIAQDSANKGAIIWSRYFADVEFDHVFVVRNSAVKFPPLIVAIGHQNDGGYIYNHFYRLNAITGEDYVSQIPEAEEFFESVLITEAGVDKVMRLPVEDPEEHTQVLAIYEAGTSRIYIYPDTTGSREAFTKFIPNFYFTHQKSKQGGEFRGYQIVEGYRGSLTASAVWTLGFPAEEKVVALASRQPDEKVASLGRSLGNRNVLYKYLNPHMFTVITAIPETETLLVRVVDAVKGSILYEAVHQNADTIHNEVHVVQSENWVVYHYWSNGPLTNGYVAVVMELYEGEKENERVVSTEFSSFEDIKPYVQSSAFTFPYPVRTMGVTTTRLGVSNREIIFGLESDQILGVTKRLLDPRRPMDKPSKDDTEEGLMPYAPIPDERRSFLSYNEQVAGINHIITSPALLESTSLVFAYGLDTFYTRSSPSKQFDVLSEDFSKSQLLLTIVGLIVGIMVAGPMVRRKRTNGLWK
ncbi:hypothetical protein J3Q64DRAFT_1754353 [Phycomyces blakesleeanus]|uniref:ER membrane protein complex subunit 1 n=2 Tax=Phycomyces blakesleeanus TaxID=4837 RepID=A0A162TC01_PHYB8|nr:hypothetical protein PHYBLDRAFT_80500 [Phycomyces blakesleeanus NRRL 1555(-)]OAD65913.1 hypothetical protein PHYBLDRAFT_80500 [Phycomyces blakesleeanus NRRL 1555(-)]|eukprot:XP_018283953.1 hypothetical protein PHYBLDRAFT_80500 [Phycomyces blakesleeanus NRRL 1555(-)]